MFFSSKRSVRTVQTYMKMISLYVNIYIVHKIQIITEPHSYDHYPWNPNHLAKSLRSSGRTASVGSVKTWGQTSRRDTLSCHEQFSSLLSLLSKQGIHWPWMEEILLFISNLFVSTGKSEKKTMP